MDFGIWLLYINWVIADYVRNELWVWDGLSRVKKIVNLIPLAIFWIMWKERNLRAFEGIEGGILKLRDRWMHIGSSCFGHDINRVEDFENFINILIEL